MGLIEVSLVNDQFGFEARDAAGQILRMDTSDENGGMNFGARPMQLVLMALGGCSGIDILSILRKQRQELKGFKAVIEGRREKTGEFSLWKEVRIVFELEGNIDADKAERACALSIDKYCSVAETLRRSGCQINWELRIKN